MIVGVKYCGGCNPHYDRTGFIEKLKTEFIDNVVIKPAATNFMYDLIIVVCGCERQCAGVKNLAARNGFIYVTNSESQHRVYSLLRNFTK